MSKRENLACEIRLLAYAKPQKVSSRASLSDVLRQGQVGLHRVFWNVSYQTFT